MESHLLLVADRLVIRLLTRIVLTQCADWNIEIYHFASYMVCVCVCVCETFVKGGGHKFECLRTVLWRELGPEREGFNIRVGKLLVVELGNNMYP